MKLYLWVFLVVIALGLSGCTGNTRYEMKLISGEIIQVTGYCDADRGFDPGSVAYCLNNTGSKDVYNIVWLRVLEDK